MKEILKYLRTINGYSQDKVASEIGLSRQAYNKYEAGTVIPSNKIVAKLADLYHVSPKFIHENTVPKLPGKDTEYVTHKIEDSLVVSSPEPVYKSGKKEIPPVIIPAQKNKNQRTYEAYFSSDAIHIIQGNNPYPYKEGQRLKVIIVEENLEEERKKKQFAWETMEQILEKRQFTYEGKDPDYDQLRHEALKEKYGPF